VADWAEVRGEARVVCAIHLTHTPRTERAHNPVRTEIRSRVEGHSRMRRSRRVGPDAMSEAY